MEENQTVQPERHICSLCKGEFPTVEEYTAHTCPSTGFTPADPQHQGPDFAAVQQAALQRGAAAQAQLEAEQPVEQPAEPTYEVPVVEAAQADPDLTVQE